MDNEEPQVQLKRRGQGKGRGCGLGKASTSLPRPGKVQQETVSKKEIPKKEDSKQKQKGVRCTRSTAEEEAKSDEEARMNLSKRCKEKANKLRGKNTGDKIQSTSRKASKLKTSALEKFEEEGDSTSPLDYLKTQEFKEIAVDVRQSMKYQLEKEGVLNNISNVELRDRICKRLIYVTGFEEVSKDHIDRVIFMSDPEQSTMDVETDPEKDHSTDELDEERDIMVLNR